jgi:hypothetical protein
VPHVLNILRFFKIDLSVKLLMPYATASMRQDTYQNGTSRPSSNRATVYEAADILGITVDAIRKRIQRGTIPYERHADGRVYVLLGELDDVRDKSSNLQDGDRDTYRTAHDTLVESLQDQIEYLRSELAVRAEESRRKDHIIAALTERIPELEAPQDAPESRETASTGSKGVESQQDSVNPQKTSQRSWWRTIFGA